MLFMFRNENNVRNFTPEFPWSKDTSEYEDSYKLKKTQIYLYADERLPS